MLPAKESAMTTWSVALSAAVQLERDGREFYLKAAAATSSPLAGKMFESLADDETKHIQWLYDLSPDVGDARAANEALFARLKGIFADVPAEVRDRAASAESVIRAIDIAIGMEEKSVAAYAEWTDKGPTAAIGRLGAVLAGQERFHRQLLENTKEYLDRPCDWFMSEERWDFEGG
jgi:rubrerythrin